MTRLRKTKLLLIFLLLTVLTVSAAGAETNQALSIPAFTETDCVWDEAGNLISETVRDLTGAPALNRRGFYRAEYTWDALNNLLTEAYFGLNGEPVNADGGFARAEYTYGVDSRKVSHLLTEDRYAADGSRAQIPGSYSYRRDAWDGDQILSSEYFDAEGNLTRPTGGYAQILYDVETGNNVVRVTKRYLDADGTPLLGVEGGATVVSVYAKKGVADNETVEKDLLGLKLDSGKRQKADTASMQLWSVEIFAVDGSKALGAEHYHRMVNTYDNQGNKVRVD